MSELASDTLSETLPAALVGKWGSTRKIGFGWAFGLSVINLFVGIIAVACSKKLDVNSSVTKEIEK